MVARVLGSFPRKDGATNLGHRLVAHTIKEFVALWSHVVRFGHRTNLDARQRHLGNFRRLIAGQRGSRLSFSEVGSSGPPRPHLAGPLYNQIYSLMRQRLASGEWKSGQPMPTENVLAQEYGVSIGTVRKALDQLARAKLIVRQQGRGTYVGKNGGPGQIGRRAWHLQCETTDESDLCGVLIPGQCELATATQVEALALQISTSQKVLRIRCTTRLEQGTISIDTFVLPVVTSGLSEALLRSESGAIHDFVASLEANATEYIDKISAIAAVGDIAVLLKTPVGSPVLRISRAGFSNANRPVFLLDRVVKLSDSAEYIASVR